MGTVMCNKHRPFSNSIGCRVQPITVRGLRHIHTSAIKDSCDSQYVYTDNDNPMLTRLRRYSD